MRFITFLKQYADNEDNLGDFARWALYRKNFIQSNSLAALERFLKGKISDKLWNGFYKAYITYTNTPGNMAPPRFKNLYRLVRKKK